MSKSALDNIIEFFRPQAPFWACELTPTEAIVAGTDRKRSRIEGQAVVDLPAGTLVPSLADANVVNSDAARTAIRDALGRAHFQGSEIGLIIPDDAARIAFLAADNLPKDPAEQITFIRWKLKKTVPFDIDSAQIAYKVLGAHAANGSSGKGFDLLVTTSPRSVIQEYERLMESLDLHAGMIVPSTLAVLNLYVPPAEDALFVKVAADCVTTTVFQSRRVTFYRKVNGAGLYDAVYPTVLYYQDKLNGTAIRHLTVCGVDSAEHRAAIADLEERLQMGPIRRLEPKTVEDIYKPALGAVHIAWQTLI